MSVALGTWTGDSFVATDGREFTVFSEHIRGEDRYYEANERRPEGDGTRRDGIGARFWRPLPTAGGYRKDAERRKVERYVRETTKQRSNDGDGH